MLKKIDKAEKPPVTASILYRTVFGMTFGWLIFRSCVAFRMRGLLPAMLYASVSLIFAAGWIILKYFISLKRYEANRNDERAFGAWLLFAAAAYALLLCFKPETSLKSAVIILLSLLLAGLLTYFFSVRETQLIITEIETVSPKLKRDKIRIVHITDLHAGLWAGSGYLKELVAAVNGQQPDVIVCTGDIKDERLGIDSSEELTLLSRLYAPCGKFAVLGCHDYTDKAEAADFLERSGFTLLDGKTEETAGITICGCGDRDHLIKSQWGLSKSEQLILDNEHVHKNKFFLILRHRQIVEDGQQTHFDLQLSGAKHGISLTRLLLRKLGI
ncbi:MAG: metallophosphoesterase, partial [Synergistaceae bacterium]|nr:metallophosphoesterase [Synergistaceae bacterium]